MDSLRWTPSPENGDESTPGYQRSRWPGTDEVRNSLDEMFRHIDADADAIHERHTSKNTVPPFPNHNASQRFPAAYPAPHTCT